MGETRRKVDLGLELLEDAVLMILREAYPEAVQANDIRDNLGIRNPRRGSGNYLTDSVFRRLEERGFVEQMGERGAWRLVVT